MKLTVGLLLTLFALDRLRALNIKVVNRCSTTLNPRYYSAGSKHADVGSIGFTLGPRAYSNITLPDSDALRVWVNLAKLNTCQVVRPKQPDGVSIEESNIGQSSYGVNHISAQSIDIDVCPEHGTFLGAAAGSHCACASRRTVNNCTCETTKFVIVFCPNDSQHGVKTTTRTPQPSPSTSTKAMEATTTSIPTTTMATTVASGTTTAYQWIPTERLCACMAEQIWLDIIVALDTSSSMTRIGLVNIQSTFASIFAELTIGQDLIYQSRVGIVTYNSNAAIVANLTQFNALDELMEILFSIAFSNVDQVNILAGLKASYTLRKEDETVLRRKVVFVLIASAYREGEDDPRPMAHQIKEDGHLLMVIAMMQQNQGVNEVIGVLQLASEGFAFRTDSDGKTLGPRVSEAFCEANCFCPDGWIQLSDSFAQPKHRYAECVRLFTTPLSWSDASQACGSLAHGKAFLISEFSEFKHNFNIDYVHSVDSRLVSYHVGLSFNISAGRYLWEETFSNGTRVQLGYSGYQPWLGGTENHAQDGNAVQVDHSGSNTFWRNIHETGTIRVSVDFYTG